MARKHVTNRNQGKSPSRSKRRQRAARKGKGLTSKAPAKKPKAVDAILSQNPFRAGSSYAACFAALRKLGLDQMHPFDAVVTEVKRQMGPEVFAEFAAKPARNERTGKSPEDRLLQNVQVISRGDKYGQPVRNAGFEVRWRGRERSAGLFTR